MQQIISGVLDTDGLARRLPTDGAKRELFILVNEHLDTRGAQAQVAALPLWRLTHLGTRIRRDWRLQNFRAVIKLLNTIGALAEREQHHPDMHLEGYCNAWIELYTHAIGGLSENDFVLAAKIDTVSPP